MQERKSFLHETGLNKSTVTRRVISSRSHKKSIIVRGLLNNQFYDRVYI